MDNRQGIQRPKTGMNRGITTDNVGDTEYTFQLNGNSVSEGSSDRYDLTDEHSNILASRFKEGFKFVGGKVRRKTNTTYFMLHNESTGISEIGYIKNTTNHDSISDLLKDEEVDCKDCYSVNKVGKSLEDIDQPEHQEYVTLLSDDCEGDSNHKCLGFDLNHPIIDIIIKEQNIGTKLFWTSTPGKKEFRYIELDNIEQYKKKGVSICGSELEDTCIDCSKLKVFKLHESLSADKYNKFVGGNLNKGVYEVFGAYCDELGNEFTNYTSLTNKIPIGDLTRTIGEQYTEDSESQYGISLNINKTDKVFSYYKIVVGWYSSKGSLSLYEYQIKPVTDMSVAITSIKGLNKISSNKLFALKPNVESVDGITEVNSRVVLHGIKQKEPINLQPVVNLLGLGVEWMTYIAKEDLYKNADSYQYACFNRGENVALSIDFGLTSGHRTNKFILIPPHKSVNSYDRELIGKTDKGRLSVEEYSQRCDDNSRTERWQYYNTAKDTGFADCGGENLKKRTVNQREKTVSKVDGPTIPEGSLTVEIVQGGKYSSVLDYFNAYKDEFWKPTLRNHPLGKYGKYFQKDFLKDYDTSVAIDPDDFCDADWESTGNVSLNVMNVIGEDAKFNYYCWAETGALPPPSYRPMYEKETQENRPKFDVDYSFSYELQYLPYSRSKISTVPTRKKKLNFSTNTTCKSAKSLPSYSSADVNATGAGDSFKYRGEYNYQDMLEANMTISKTTFPDVINIGTNSEQLFFDKIHKNGLWYKIEAKDRKRFAVEISKQTPFDEESVSFKGFPKKKTTYKWYKGFAKEVSWHDRSINVKFKPQDKVRVSIVDVCDGEVIYSKIINLKRRNYIAIGSNEKKDCLDDLLLEKLNRGNAYMVIEPPIKKAIGLHGDWQDYIEVVSSKEYKISRYHELIEEHGFIEPAIGGVGVDKDHDGAIAGAGEDDTVIRVFGDRVTVSPTTSTVVDVLANDDIRFLDRADIDIEVLDRVEDKNHRYFVTEEPKHGWVILSLEGDFEYICDDPNAPVDTFKYRIEDQKLNESIEKTVTITLLDNDATISSNTIEVLVEEGGEVEFKANRNDIETPGQSVTNVILDSNTPKTNVVISPDHTVKYKHTTGDTDTFNLKITYSTGDVVTKTINIIKADPFVNNVDLLSSEGYANMPQSGNEYFSNDRFKALAGDLSLNTIDYDVYSQYEGSIQSTSEGKIKYKPKSTEKGKKAVIGYHIRGKDTSGAHFKGTTRLVINVAEEDIDYAGIRGLRRTYVSDIPHGFISVADRSEELSEVSITWDKIYTQKEEEYERECTYEVPEPSDCEPQPYRKGTMGYYESTRLYPDNPELYDSSWLSIDKRILTNEKFLKALDVYTQYETDYTITLTDRTDFTCEPIRHYQMPDNTVAPFMGTLPLPGTSESVIYPLGFTINHEVIPQLLDVALDNNLITEDERASIVDYNIYRADMTLDRSVVSSGLIYTTKTYKEDNKVINYFNYPYNQLGEDKFFEGNVDEEHAKKGARLFQYISPETDYSHVKEVPEITLQGFQYGGAISKLAPVKNHSKMVILGSSSRSLANSLAWLEVGLESAINLADAWKAYNQQAGTSTTIWSGAFVATALVAGAQLTGTLYFKKHRYYSQWERALYDNGTPRNYAYYQFGHSNYNYLGVPDEQSIRATRKSKKIGQGFFKVDNDYINNNWREKSVVVDLGDHPLTDFPDKYLKYDNSNTPYNSSQVLSSEIGCSTNASIRRVASPYVSVRVYRPDQYGEVGNISWVSTGNPKKLEDDYCRGFLGGDTFIARHSKKRKVKYFSQDLIGVADRTGFDYKYYSLYGDNIKYYIQYKVKVDEKANQDDKYMPSLYFGNEMECVDNSSDYYIKPPAKFYTHNISYASFLCETRINTNYRYAKKEPWNQFYPQNTSLEDITQPDTVSLNRDEEFFYNTAYSEVGKTSLHGGLLPLTYDSYEMSKTQYNKNSVMYSSPDTSENSSVEPWLVYKPLDLVALATKYGDLTNIKGIESDQVLLYYEQGVSMINAKNPFTDGQTSYNSELGNGGIFSKRHETFYSTDMGYGGTVNKQTLSCEFGHFHADVPRGQVFNIRGTKMEEISKVANGKPTNMDVWFKEHLPYKIKEYFPDFNGVDNAYNGVGIVWGYDSKFKRIFLTKKDYIPVDKSKLYLEDNNFYDRTGLDDKMKELGDDWEIHSILEGVALIELKNSGPIDLDNSILLALPKISFNDKLFFTDTSFTVSYKPEVGSWDSYMSFKPNYYINHHNYFQTGVNIGDVNEELGLWSHLLTNKSYRVFYGKKYPYIIEYIIKNEYIAKTLEYLNWQAQLKRYHNEYDYAVLEQNPFDYFTVYNDYENSGRLKATLSNGSMRQKSKYPITKGDVQEVLVDYKGYSYGTNYFFNRVKSNRNNQPIWNWDINQIDKVINNRAVSFYGKKTLERLRGNWFKVRLERVGGTDYDLDFKWSTNKANIKK